MDACVRVCLQLQRIHCSCFFTCRIFVILHKAYVSIPCSMLARPIILKFSDFLIYLLNFLKWPVLRVVYSLRCMFMQAASFSISYTQGVNFMWRILCDARSCKFFLLSPVHGGCRPETQGMACSAGQAGCQRSIDTVFWWHTSYGMNACTWVTNCSGWDLPYMNEWKYHDDWSWNDSITIIWMTNCSGSDLLCEKITMTDHNNSITNLWVTNCSGSDLSILTDWKPDCKLREIFALLTHLLL